MGGCTFMDTATGKSAREAFRSAVEAAQYEHGHGGYTGTIAEKNDFVMIARNMTMSPTDQVHTLIEAGDPRIDDKWGPAGCFDLGDGRFMFFGWASS